MLKDMFFARDYVVNQSHELYYHIDDILHLLPVLALHCHDFVFGG